MNGRTLHKRLLGMQRNLSRSKPEYVDATRRMLYLVKAVDLTLESLYEGPALERALWRYEALWLPLLVAIEVDTSFACTHQNFARKVEDIRTKNSARGGLHLTAQDLVPPLDIAWVWHCHRLNPEAYIADTAALTNGGPPLQTDMERAFKFSDGEDAQSRQLRRLWDVIYPFESYMPRYLLSCTYQQEHMRKRQNITSYANEIGRTGFRSVLTYNIRKAAQLQRTFLYQVIDENCPEKEELYESNVYLNRAYDRYLLFLALHRNKSTTTLLVPMKDINIMWQMHLSCTTEYERDCVVLVGYTIPHDSLAVEELRLQRLHEYENDPRAGSQDTIDTSRMEESERAELEHWRQRGVSIKETKTLWECCYGSNPRYDLPDTYYRGQPPGERGGFRQVFEKTNGSTKDIPWPETLARMFLAVVIGIAGVLLSVWSFYRTMVSHAKYLIGIPLGIAIITLGLYMFLAIPISRPLSSDSRFWQERSFKQTHNPLPSYLISSTTKND